MGVGEFGHIWVRVGTQVRVSQTDLRGVGNISSRLVVIQGLGAYWRG